MSKWDDFKKDAENAAIYGLWQMGPGLFGLPLEDYEVKEWQAENPKTALGIDLASWIPGFGGYKAAIKGTKFAKAANELASAEKYAMNPFISTAKKEMLEFAPFEAGRQIIGGVAQEMNPEAFGEVDWSKRAWESGLNIAGAGVLAGGLGKLASAGKVAKLPDVLKEVDRGDPWQHQLRKIHEAMLKAEGDDLGVLQQAGWEVEGKILTERSKKPVGDADLDWANQLFKGTPTNPSRMFIVGDGGFEKVTTRDKVLQAAGLPEGWIENVQYPRYLDGKGKFGKTLDNRIQDRLDSIGNNWYMKTEKDGLTVVAKKLDDGKWFVAKTDNPEFFNPEGARLKQAVEKSAWRDPDTIIKKTGDAENPLDMALNFEELTAPGVGGLAASDNSIAGISKRVAEKVGGKLIEDVKDNQLVNNIQGFLKDYFEPTMFQFKNSPLARNIFARAQYTRDTFIRKAQEMILGRANTKGKSVFNITGKGISREGVDSFAEKLRAFGDKATDDQLNSFFDAVYGGHSFDEIAASADWRRKLGVDGLDCLQTLNTMDKAQYERYMKIIKNLGFDEGKMYPFRNDHYGLSHTWKGSIRQAIMDEQGKLVHVVSGDNKKGVQKLAEGVLAEAKAEGRDWKLGHWWTKNRELDIKNASLMKASDYELAEDLAQRYLQKNPELGNAGFFKYRAGVGGYTKAKSVDEFLKNLLYSYENKAIYFGNLANEKLLAKDLQILAINDPKTAEMLASKLSALKGEQGPLSQLVNKVADSVLAPVLGTDSASKIVSALNKASVHLDLGFGNLAYVTANLLQPVTTVLPMLSMIKNCPEAVQWAFDSIPLFSKTGAGMVNIPNPLKVMKQGLKLMAKPASMEGFESALEKAVNEGALSPKFIESYVGENSGLSKGLAEAWKEGDFSSVLMKISTGMGNFSEQASRGYAFSTGYALFKSMQKAGAKLTDEQVYAGAKKLMETTMFQFGAADKARILQGPVGGAWGLFKNWTMHYVGWQMEYLNAGLKHNCWTPWLWSNVATSALGGMTASEIGSVAAAFAEQIGEDKFANQLYNAWGDGVGTSTALYGIPGALGFSLQSQVNSPLTSPMEELGHFMGMVYWNRLKAMGSTMQAGIDWFTSSGQHPGSSDAFKRQITRAFAPKAIYRQMQMDGGNLLTSSGRKVLGDLSNSEQMMYGVFNLPSTRIQQALEATHEIYSDKEKMMKLTGRYAEGVMQAIMENDGMLLEALIQRACADGVDIDSVMKSAQKRMENVLVSPLERGENPSAMWLEGLHGWFL